MRQVLTILETEAGISLRCPVLVIHSTKASGLHLQKEMTGIKQVPLVTGTC